MAYLPLLPAQLLRLNLVTNGIQDVALAFEPNEGACCGGSPAPGTRFDRLMVERTVLAAVVMGVAAFLTFRWLLPAGATGAEVASARNSLLLLMVLFESIQIGNCRSETKSALRLSPLRNPILLFGAVGALLVHLGAMYLPLGQTVLGTAPVGLDRWALLLAVALVIFPVMELHKWTWTMRHGRQAG